MANQARQRSTADADKKAAQAKFAQEDMQKGTTAAQITKHDQDRLHLAPQWEGSQRAGAYLTPDVAALERMIVERVKLISITHVPTNIVVTCQDERSQIKNRAKAMRVLKSRLLELERERAESELSEERRKMVGRGDRSEKIRTYNFPQNRVTDHRINLTLYKLDEVLTGGVEQVIQPLINEYQADQLAALSA